jgi:cytochrome c-type biogenesis protein CcmH/NrfG
MIANAVKRHPRTPCGRFIAGISLLFAAITIPVGSQRTQEDAGTSYYNAAKDVEVGQFYMRKGDVDAAIDRFQDAIKQKPNFARPRVLLGEAYEKKGDKAQALKYYKEYLEVLPKAPDAAKIRKRIEKLSKELDKNSSAVPSWSDEALKKSLRTLEMRVSFFFAPEFRRV